MEFFHAFLVYSAMMMAFFVIGRRNLEQYEEDKSALRYFRNMFLFWIWKLPVEISNLENKDQRDEVAAGVLFVWLLGCLGFYKALNIQMAEWQFFAVYIVATAILALASAVALLVAYLRDMACGEGEDGEA